MNSTPRHDPEPTPDPSSEQTPLRSAGELVAQGGLAGAVMTLVYVAIGIGFWSLVGWGLDKLLGTHWIVWLGAGIGAFAGIYLVFVHLQNASKEN